MKSKKRIIVMSLIIVALLAVLYVLYFHTGYFDVLK